MKSDRRTFVGETGLALAGIAGAIRGLEPGGGAVTHAAKSGIASFGWEATNLAGNGAAVSFEVTQDLTLTAADLDLAFMITAPPSRPGFAEVLCRGAVSPGAPPKFHNDAKSAVVSPQSASFGTLQVHNPHKLGIVNDGYLLQNIFHNVILKTWVGPDGTGSSTYRHVRITPLLALQRGDFLVFTMDHAGVAGDCELQVVFEYKAS
jgi:hypothetical protein